MNSDGDMNSSDDGDDGVRELNQLAIPDGEALPGHVGPPGPILLGQLEVSCHYPPAHKVVL